MRARCGLLIQGDSPGNVLPSIALPSGQSALTSNGYAFKHLGFEVRGSGRSFEEEKEQQWWGVLGEEAGRREMGEGKGVSRRPRHRERGVSDGGEV